MIMLVVVVVVVVDGKTFYPDQMFGEAPKAVEKIRRCRCSFILPVQDESSEEDISGGAAQIMPNNKICLGKAGKPQISVLCTIHVLHCFAMNVNVYLDTTQPMVACYGSW